MATVIVLMICFVILSSDNYAETGFRHLQTPLHGNNGGVIAFHSDRDGNPEIYVMNADGSSQTRLTSHPLHDMNPSISPDGRKIAFLTSRYDPNAAANFPRCNFEIHIINVDGSNEFQLTNIASYAGFISWSPDGTKLVFQADCGSDGKKEIYVINSDGTNLTRLTNNPCNDVWPDWSPNNSKIVFCSDRDGNYEIYSMNIDGSNQQRITTNNSMDGMPRWSPDGSQVAFMTDRAGYQAIWVMNANGTNARQLTNQTDQFGESPAWSPDGKLIAYHAPKDNNYEICAMDGDGSNHKRLTNHNGNDMWPAWGLGSVATEVKENGDSHGSMPLKFQLFQNYPNPFNSSTCIQYTINSTHSITLRVYDMLGKEVEMLVNEEKPMGEHQTHFTGIGLASGMYFYRLQLDNDAYQIKSMCLMK
jgi:Tol biopolymer transport system component